MLPTSRPTQDVEPQFDDEVYLLSPVPNTSDCMAGEEPMSRIGQLAGLRDAVGNRVTLVSVFHSLLTSSDVSIPYIQLKLFQFK